MGAKLDELITKVNKEAKGEIITQGLATFNYERVPFTSPQMNHITYGGLALGRLYEFYGEEGGGKTTTALDIVANFQNLYPDREVLYIDAENTLDADWATKIGVDVKSLKIFQPEEQSAEEIFQIIKDAVDTGELGLWILDSIPTLTAQADLGKDLTDDEKVAGISKPLTKFSRQMVGLCKRNNCMGIGINQPRDKIGSTIPGQTTTPGGRAWKHFCSARFQFTKGPYLDENGKTLSRSSGNPVGNRVIVNMTKDKISKPDRHVGQYTINYEMGIDYIADLIDVGMYYNIIEKSGSWFTILNPDTGEIIKDKLQGQANVAKFLDENTDTMAIIEDLVEIHSNI